MEQLVNEATASQRQPYEPKPMDTTGIDLPPAILGLGEKLAEHVHDVRALNKIAGWNTEHPDLIPYSEFND